MQYIATNGMNEKKFSEDLDDLIIKIDKLNETACAKWYIMEYTDSQYEALVERRMNYKLVPGKVVHDPFNRSERDLDYYYYVHPYTKRMGDGK